MILIADLQYFGVIDLYKNINQETNIVFESYDRFQKMSFRNRTWVAGADGPLLLSVPLAEGRDQRRLTREVRIANQYPWQSNHWKTIQSCYNRSPWFEYYRDSLQSLFGQHFDSLADWDLACMKWTLAQLKWKNPVEFTTEYQPSYPASSYFDYRGKFIPKSIVLDFPEVLTYRQVFEERTGFQPHLSILDLLFCEGPAAGEKLRGGSKNH